MARREIGTSVDVLEVARAFGARAGCVPTMDDVASYLPRWQQDGAPNSPEEACVRDALDMLLRLANGHAARA